MFHRHLLKFVPTLEEKRLHRIWLVIRPSFTLGGTGAAMYIKKILMSFTRGLERRPFMKF
jgi:hypothetical protein